MLGFFNNNPGLISALGVLVGSISLIVSCLIYKMQKDDDFKKEKRERFERKAELSVNEDFIVKGNNAKELHIIPCPYSVRLGKDGYIYTAISKRYADKNKLQCDIIYLENTGKSDIYELGIATADPKNTALLEVKVAEEYIKEGYISYGIMLDRKIRVGEAIELDIYYDDKTSISNPVSASIEIYYRDSLNNICAQPLFIKERKIYEPRLIEYSEWRKQVSVEKNLEHWRRRLQNK